MTPLAPPSPGTEQPRVQTAQRVAGENPVVEVRHQTAAEDFSIFANATRGLYLFLGSAPPGGDAATSPSDRSPEFDVYEPGMGTDAQIFAHLAVDYLQGR